MGNLFQWMILSTHHFYLILFYRHNLHKGHILPNLMVVKSNFDTETTETTVTIQPEQISLSFIALGQQS